VHKKKKKQQQQQQQQRVHGPWDSPGEK
jgi:hypothetical protein